MASLKHQQKLLKGIVNGWKNVNAGCRGVSTKISASGRTARYLPAGLVAAGTAGYLYSELRKRWPIDNVSVFSGTVHAREAPPSIQDTVVSGNKNHAGYIWIHLKPNADAKACLNAVCDLQAHIKSILGKDASDEDEEIIAGVALGPKFYAKLGGKIGHDFAYVHRKGIHGDMPDAGGDIFIHTKSHSMSNLFDMSKRVINALPRNSVDKFEDIYSFTYRYGRDLSGFIDGTENPADEEHRQQVAVDKATGSSYLITQKWIHNHVVIDNEKDSTLEGWIGRQREDSVELKKKPTTSHVARMVGGTELGQKKPLEIVRQSMPFGTLAGDSGLFFIAYAASPQNFNYMLDRMIGKHDDKHNDDVMRLSKCVRSTYWYVPSKEELLSLRK